MSTDVPPSPDNLSTPSIGDPRLQEAYGYWLQMCAGRALPSRRDLDPVDIPKLLPHVLLVEVHDGGRYRYRLIGTENVREHGMDATGRYLDDVLPGPESKAHVLPLYGKSAQEPRPASSE